MLKRVVKWKDLYKAISRNPSSRSILYCSAQEIFFSFNLIFSCSKLNKHTAGKKCVNQDWKLTDIPTELLIKQKIEVLSGWVSIKLFILIARLLLDLGPS